MFNWTWKQFNFCVSFYFACLLYLLVNIIDYRYFTIHAGRHKGVANRLRGKADQGFLFLHFSLRFRIPFPFPRPSSFLSFPLLLAPSFPSFFLQIQLRDPRSAVSSTWGRVRSAWSPDRESILGISWNQETFWRQWISVLLRTYRVLTDAS